MPLPSVYVNLSIYAFGFTGLWTSVGSVVLPLLVTDLAGDIPLTIFGLTLEKNGAVSVIGMIGGVVAGIVQPIAGMISDRTRSSYGKRLPYIAVGTIGLIPFTLLMGITQSILALAGVWAIMQLFGTIAQGPANALILDHVSNNRRGIASGALILARALGGGIVSAVVLALMAGYNNGINTYWLWTSLGFVAGVVILTSSWTIYVLRPGRDCNDPNGLDERLVASSKPETATSDRPRSQRGYPVFLFALALVIAGMSALPMYAVFYMDDMVGSSNPAQALLLVVAILAPVVAVTVIPAGRLSDRIGRSLVLTSAGLLGSIGVLILAFVPVFSVVLIATIPIAISVGVFFTVMWAIANDMVGQSSAGRDLGLTGISFLFGAIIARSFGFIIDILNEHSPNFGYQAMLVFIAITFILVPLVVTRFQKNKGPANGTVEHGFTKPLI